MEFSGTNSQTTLVSGPVYSADHLTNGTLESLDLPGSTPLGEVVQYSIWTASAPADPFVTPEFCTLGLASSQPTSYQIPSTTSAQCPNEVPNTLKGPPIGFKALPTASGLSNFQMVYDSCWCSRSVIQAFDTIQTQEVNFGVSLNIPIQWSGIKHSLESVWPTSADCQISLKDDQSGSLFAFDQGTMSLNLLNSVQPGTYTVNVVAYMTAHENNEFVSAPFTLRVLDTSCQATQIVQPQTPIGTLVYKVDDASVPTEHVFAEILDSVSEAAGLSTHCGVREYSLDTNEVASVDSATRTISVEIPSARFDLVGTHDLNLNVNLPNYNLSFQVAFKVEITHACQDTTLEAPSAALVYATQFDEGPVTINLDDFKDQISTSSGNQDGVTYCGAREYTLTLGAINFVEMTDTQDLSSFVWQTSVADPAFFTLSQLPDLMTTEVVTDGASGLQTGVLTAESPASLENLLARQKVTYQAQLKHFPTITATAEVTVLTVPQCDVTPVVAHAGEALTPSHDIFIQNGMAMPDFGCVSGDVMPKPMSTVIPFTENVLKLVEPSLSFSGCGRVVYKVEFADGSGVDEARVMIFDEDFPLKQAEIAYSATQNFHNRKYMFIDYLNLILQESLLHELRLVMSLEKYPSAPPLLNYFNVAVLDPASAAANHSPVLKVNPPELLQLYPGQNFDFTFELTDKDGDKLVWLFELIIEVCEDQEGNTKSAEDIAQIVKADRLEYKNLFDESTMQMHFEAKEGYEGMCVVYKMWMNDGKQNGDSVYQTIEVIPIPEGTEMMEAVVEEVVDFEPEFETVEEPVHTSQFQVREDQSLDAFNYTEAMALLGDLFSSGKLVTSPADIKKIQGMFPYPVPYATKFSASGDIKLDFSQLLGSTAGNLMKEIIESGMLKLTLLSKGDANSEDYDIRRVGTGFFENEDEPEVEETKADVDEGARYRQLLQEEQMNFNWTMSELTDSGLSIKLNFERSDLISQETDDKVVIVFVVTDFLKGNAPNDENEQLPMDFQLVINVPKQKPANDNSLLDAAADFSTVTMQAVTVTNALVTLTAQGSLQQMWASINSLQLIVYLPLNNVDFPKAAMLLFEQMIKIVTFDIMSLQSLVGIEENWMGFTETAEFNQHFLDLGYESQNTILNLGFINVVIIMIILQLFVFSVFRCIFGKPKRNRKDSSKCKEACTNSMSLSNRCLRFMIEVMIEFLMCSILTLAPAENDSIFDLEEWKPVDKLMLVYTFILLTCLSLFIFVTIWYVFVLSKRMNKIQKNKRIFAHSQIMKASLNYGIQKAAKNSQAKKSVTENKNVFQSKLMRKMSVDFEQSFKKKYLEENEFSSDYKRSIEHLADMAKQDKLCGRNGGKVFMDKYEKVEEVMPLNISEVKTLRHFETFQTGLRSGSQAAYLYYLLYILRRVGLVAPIFLLYHFPVAQLHIFLLFSASNMMYLCAVQPFELKSTQRLELFNEVCCYVSGLHALLFTRADHSEKTTELVGWSLTCFLIVIILGNMIVLGYGGIVSCKKNCYIKNQRKSAKSQAETFKEARKGKPRKRKRLEDIEGNVKVTEWNPNSGPAVETPPQSARKPSVFKSSRPQIVDLENIGRRLSSIEEEDSCSQNQTPQDRKELSGIKLLNASSRSSCMQNLLQQSSREKTPMKPSLGRQDSDAKLESLIINEMMTQEAQKSETKAGLLIKDQENEGPKLIDCEEDQRNLEDQILQFCSDQPKLSHGIQGENRNTNQGVTTDDYNRQASELLRIEEE